MSAVGGHPRPQDPMIGRTIAGKFKIEARLGEGAMGTVYRAWHTTLGKTVAIKILRPEWAIDPAFAERFHREATAASRLDHENSVRVLDYGVEPNGVSYIVMECLNGKNLGVVLHHAHPLPATRIVEVLSQVLAALAVAHDMGILHRDLKPENIMILEGKNDEGAEVDHVKVCDFGIAKIFGTLETNTGPQTTIGHLTNPGLAIGTPAYMSPEQARGESLDVRSDLYAVGVILYELLTGRVPFAAETPLGMALQHINDSPVPPSQLQAVDAALETVCLRAMSKAKIERYQTAREMRAALRTSPSEGTPVRSESAASRRPADRWTWTLLPSTRWSFGILVATAIVGVNVLVIRALRPIHISGQTTKEASTEPRLRAPTAALIIPTILLEPPSPSIEPTDTELGRRPGPTPSTVMPRPAKTFESVHAARRRADSAPLDAASTARQQNSRDVSRANPSIPAEPVTAIPRPLNPLAQAPAVASSAPASAPAFDLATARVEVRQPINLMGDTSPAKVGSAIGRVSGKLNACYRSALPRLVNPREGAAMLHVETDETGLVTVATLKGPPFASDVASCIVASVKTCTIDGVDTGSASADIPLLFKAR